MSPAAPALSAGTPFTPECISAIVDASHDCMVVVGGDGLVLSANAVCPCGRAPCDDAVADISPGSPLPSPLRGDVLSGALSSGRFRGIVGMPLHGGDAWVEASSVRLSGDLPLVAVTLRDVTDRHIEADRAAILAGELRHRLGNAYAIAMAVMSSSAREEDPVGTALRRLGSLARVQELRSGPEGLSLLDMASAIAEGLSPQGVVAPPPDFDARLSTAQVQSLLLVSGELCANSLKHGALRHGGAVTIDWRRTPSGFEMVWTERCPVPASRGDRDGASGFRLMSSMMRSSGGSLVDEWPGEGLRVTAVMPAATMDVAGGGAAA